MIKVTLFDDDVEMFGFSRFVKWGLQWKKGVVNYMLCVYIYIYIYIYTHTYIYEYI